MEDQRNIFSLKVSSSPTSKKINRTISSFILICLLGLIFYSIDASRLPDFDSYYIMYYKGESLGRNYECFYNITLFFQKLGFDYQQFRHVVLLAGLVFASIILRLRRNSYLYHSGSLGIFPDKSIKILILISIFIFEFYLIRLRAGISIFFFLLFFYALQYPPEYKVNLPLRFILLLGIVLVSALIHLQTFITIALFIGPAALWSRYIKSNGSLNKFLYFTLCLIAWLALFWLGISDSSLEHRGSNLASNLNIVRFVMISILPIMIWPFLRKFYPGNERELRGKKSFPYLYALNYVCSAIALLTYYYFSSVAEGAGEAIVRVMTLSSFGAIISLALGGVAYRNIMALYILVINSLFFLNSIYG
jgi:hypothetical protein